MVGKVQLNTNSILEEKYMYRKKSWWSCDIIYRNEDPHEKSDVTQVMMALLCSGSHHILKVELWVVLFQTGSEGFYVQYIKQSVENVMHLTNTRSQRWSRRLGGWGLQK